VIAAPAGRGPARSRTGAALALALAAGAALYLPNLRLQLLADDFAFLDGALSYPPLQWLGTTAGVSYYRPFSRQLYTGLMSRLCGAQPLPYHLVNLALLILAAWLLARLAARLAAPAAGPLAAATFLAQHGASVLTGWAAGAQDLFAVALTAATLLLHRAGRTGLSLAACAAALFSKETAAAAPLLVLLLEGLRPGARPLTALRRAAPHLALLAAWGLGYALWFRRLPGAPPVGVLDVRADAGAIPATLLRSLLALVNLDAGFSLRLTAGDLVRALVAAALGTAGVLLAGRRARDAHAGAAASGEGAPRGRERRAPRKRAPGAAPGRAPEAAFPLALLGTGWILLGLVPVMLVGHRWSSYLTVMAGAGGALLAAALLHRRPRAAAVAVAALLLAGPAADAVTGGPIEGGSASTWNLGRVRRLSAFVDGLRRALQRQHPSLEPGSAVLLSRVPNLSLVALHGPAAVHAWYADTSLSTGSVEDLRAERLPAHLVVLDCDPTVEPYRWTVESDEFVGLRVAVARAFRAQRPAQVVDAIERARRAPEWQALSETWRAGALLTLGQACQSSGRPAEAERAYRESVRLQPDRAASWFGLGMALTVRGALPEALPALAEAARLQPAEPVYQFSYGAALAEAGGAPAEAAAHLRRALDLGLAEPNRRAAQALLAELAARPSR